MKTKLKRYLLKSGAITLILSSINSANAQESAEAPSTKQKSPWSVHCDFGLIGFSTSGIPLSRNQINFNQANPENQSTYLQESRIASFGWEIALKRRVSPRMKMGLLLNSFKDNDEYLATSNSSIGTLETILTDTLHNLSVLNKQSYFNVGLSIDYLIYQSSSTKHQFYCGLSTGLSINRTPDRSEYDYCEETHFVAANVPTNDDWRVTHTDFKNGFFIAPTLNYSIRIKNNHSLRISASEFLQWHSTEQELKILDKNSSGAQNITPYSLKAFQLKIGYSF